MWSKGRLISKKRLFRLGAMVSDQYCVIHVWGMGIHGRVWGLGLRGSRRITIECYVPACSQTLELEISMEQLRDLFDERLPEERAALPEPEGSEYVPPMLEAGHKAELSELLGRMLYVDAMEAARRSEQLSETLAEASASVAATQSAAESQAVEQANRLRDVRGRLLERHIEPAPCRCGCCRDRARSRRAAGRRAVAGHACAHATAARHRRFC